MFSIRGVVLKIYFLALGHKLPSWVNAGIEEYTKRMPPEARVEVIELKPEVRASRTTERVLALEAERIRAAIPKGAMPIVCDEKGKTLTTPMLSLWMGEWMRDGINPCFIVGSADGLSTEIKQSAAHMVALSGCVLPHAMVRLILAEQAYRAWSLLHNHPYHRE